jgi:hypothetical protein
VQRDPSERVDGRWFAGLSSPTAIVISILVVYVLLVVGVYALITSFARSSFALRREAA